MPSLIDTKNVYDIIHAFYTFEKGSDEFWEKLKHILKERILHENMLLPKAVSLIIKVFNNKDLIDSNFMVSLENQLFRVAKSLYGEDLSNVIYLFGLKNLVNEQLFGVFNQQVRENKHMMDSQSLAHVLASFIKVGQGTDDLYDDVETELLENPRGEELKLSDLSGLMFVYARYLPFAVQNSPKRQHFVNSLVKKIRSKSKSLGKTSDLTIVHSLWAFYRLNLEDEIVKSQLIYIYQTRNLKENPQHVKLSEEIIKHI